MSRSLTFRLAAACGLAAAIAACTTSIPTDPIRTPDAGRQSETILESGTSNAPSTMSGDSVTYCRNGTLGSGGRCEPL
jgi:hypothetical protein